MRGLEIGLDGWYLPKNYKRLDREDMIYKLRVPNPERFVVLKQAFEDGMTVEEINAITAIDRWWLDQMNEVMLAESFIKTQKLEDIGPEDFREIKKMGFSDAHLGHLL